MQLTADSPAVIAHINALQDVIRRMADNSRSCKLWCVTLVSAMLVLVADLGDWKYALLAIFPILALGTLDTYYLSLEKRFRCAYCKFVKKLDGRVLAPTEVFIIKPGDITVLCMLKRATSRSVWLFYLMLLAMVAVAIVIGTL